MTTTTTGNSRITTINGNTLAERIATETHIFYNPLNQSADIIFQGEQFLSIDENLFSKLDGRESLGTTLAAIASETYDAGVDPVTGSDLSNVSPAGVTQIIKAVYNKLHNVKNAGDHTSTEPRVIVEAEDASFSNDSDASE
jgi:hypothetical protein